jgi:uncharacterized phage protein gp47/JayE
MARGLPTPKSREQILSEMVSEYIGLTGVNDINTGSVMTQFFDVVARSIARTSGDIFQILRDFSLDRATGEALVRIGEEERVKKRTSQVATGRVTVKDTRFQKIATKVYSGSAAPNINSTTIRVSDASKFPSTGRIYIGRGTPNVEGPIDYVAINQVGAFWEITLATPTQKFHNISENVILGQGGTRTVQVGVTATSPGVGATPDVFYNVTSQTILLDGEDSNPGVQIAAQEPGSFGNAPAGAIRQFIVPPFPGASVINEIPLINGADEESDDSYRDRIKKARISKGLGTANAVKNAVLGAQASDENARVVSNEIDTSNPEETVLYIDDGQGYEEKTSGVGLEFVIDSAIGGEQTFQMVTGGRQTSVAKAFIETTESGPFDIRPFDRLTVLVGGESAEHIFLPSDMRSPGAVTAYEVVASINNNAGLPFFATTSGAGTKVVLQAKSEENEFIQISKPIAGVDAAPKMGFSLNEANTVLLYKNRNLLNKNGRPASVFTNDKFTWDPSITSGDTLTISVDKTPFITYTFNNQDFIIEGQHSFVSSQNSITSWVNVFNAKVTGVTASIDGEKIKLTSNLGSSNRASVEIDENCDLVQKGMFSNQQGLSAKGFESDYFLSRNTAQIKLKTPLRPGDSLTLGSEFTRAEVKSGKILGSQISLSTQGFLWLLVDDSKVQPVGISVGLLNISKPAQDIVRYESPSPNAFSNVEIGDYCIIWSDQIFPSNRIEARVHNKTDNYLEFKITTTEYNNILPEGPIVYQEGITVIRTEKTPQKINIPIGVYNINTVASLINQQLSNAFVTIENDEFFVIRTNTEGETGSVFIVDFNDPVKNFNFIKNTLSVGIASQLAYYQTTSSDKDLPSFVHGKIVDEDFADPSQTNINFIELNEDLENLSIQPSGKIGLSQPYLGPYDIVSSESVNISDINGTTVSIEDSYNNKRNRIDDRFHVLEPYNFGHEDTLVVVLDQNPVEKTFDIPLFRNVTTNAGTPANQNTFRAFDQGSGNSEFSQFFPSDFSFKNYKVLMQAKNIIDPSSMSPSDAILFRAAEWGASGEKIGVGYFYPASANQPLNHDVQVNTDVKVNIFLKSGPVVFATFDGSTQWNVNIINTPSGDLVTYSYSGTGTAPDLNSVVAGNYVSILSTGEFLPQNTGTFVVQASTVNSFTVLRQAGVASVQNEAATLLNNTISFFEQDDVEAQEIVAYVNFNISDFITAEIIEDTTFNGTGIINLSTLDDSGFQYERVYLKDGINYLLDSNINAVTPNPQFFLKRPLEIPFFDTTTPEAYSFVDGENLKFVPVNAEQVFKFTNVLAVSGFSTLGQIKLTNRESKVQISTNTLGSDGSVQVAGGSANSSGASIQGSSFVIGTQPDAKILTNIPRSASAGVHSGQWVKVEAGEIQKKVTGISAQNTVEVVSNTPSVGFSKVIIGNKQNNQILFGENRYHTRTSGKTFIVEKQGNFTCIAWDENGPSPSFQKQININDTVPGEATITANSTQGTMIVSVQAGNISFEEVSIGDFFQVQNRFKESNNGTFIVLAKPNNQTIVLRNPDAINEYVRASFTITDNTQVLGNQFIIGSETLTEGVDFTAGANEVETAENLSDAINGLLNYSAFFLNDTVFFESLLDNVTVPISVVGLGATASGSQMEATAVVAGDFLATSEVQEGDTVTLAAPFNVLNRGSYTVIRRFKNSVYIDNPNTVPETVTLTPNIVSASFDNTTQFDIIKNSNSTVLQWNGNGTQPNFSQVKTGNVITIGSDFLPQNQGSFSIVKANQTSVEFKNSLSQTESNITISDVLEFNAESMVFKQYEGTVSGDFLVFSEDFLDNNISGSFGVVEVLNNQEVIIQGILNANPPENLTNNFNKLYIEERKKYVGYKKIDFISTNPDNSNIKSVVFDSQFQANKINQVARATFSSLSKLNFPLEIYKGVDSYRYHTGLIGEANRIVYGDPRDNTTYPGVGAAGAEIFIKAPLVRRVEVSIAVRVRTGVPFVTVAEEVRNSVAALINSNPVGQPIAISNIISTVDAILGVRAVSISSPLYDTQNDIIRINANEKALVLDAIADVLVSKVD